MQAWAAGHGGRGGPGRRGWGAPREPAIARLKRPHTRPRASGCRTGSTRTHARVSGWWYMAAPRTSQAATWLLQGWQRAARGQRRNGRVSQSKEARIRAGTPAGRWRTAGGPARLARAHSRDTHPPEQPARATLEARPAGVGRERRGADVGACGGTSAEWSRRQEACARNRPQEVLGVPFLLQVGLQLLPRPLAPRLQRVAGVLRHQLAYDAELRLYLGLADVAGFKLDDLFAVAVLERGVEDVDETHGVCAASLQPFQRRRVVRHVGAASHLRVRAFGEIDGPPTEAAGRNHLPAVCVDLVRDDVLALRVRGPRHNRIFLEVYVGACCRVGGDQLVARLGPRIDCFRRHALALGLCVRRVGGSMGW